MPGTTGDAADPNATPGDLGVELVYRYDAANPYPDRFSGDPGQPGRPVDAAEAADRLVLGNAWFSGFMRSCHGGERSGVKAPETARRFVFHCNRTEVGLDDPRQAPFAAILGCVDARFPMELALGQGFDDIFAIRTAGNTLATDGEGMGSLYYALTQFAPLPESAPKDDGHPRPLRLVLILAHTRCGAVGAAYDALVRPDRPPSPGGPPMPAGRYSILWEIVPAARLVAERFPDLATSDPDVLKAMIAVVNAGIVARSVDRLVKGLERDGRIAPGVIQVRSGIFLVEDFHLGAFRASTGDLPVSAPRLLPPLADEALLDAAAELFLNGRGPLA